MTRVCPGLLALFLAGGAVRAGLDGQVAADWRARLARVSGVRPGQMRRAHAGQPIKPDAGAAIWRALEQDRPKRRMT